MEGVILQSELELDKSALGRTPTGRRVVVDRARLNEAFAAIHKQAASPAEARAGILAEAKRELEAGRQAIRRRFEEGEAGPVIAQLLCFLADQLVRAIYDHVTGKLYPLANPSSGERLALVALGGYGRGEMAPYSDVDLLFLYPYKLTPRSEQVIEETLYFLWDLGLKVGQASRSVDECLRLARADVTIRTSLLEARWLWGDQDLFQELKQRYAKEVREANGARFIEAKLAERAERHQRTGGSRYSLEPNIKDGKGGLRDLHTLFWIAKSIYGVDDIAALVSRGVFTRAEAKRFDKALNFLWTLRCHMHYEAGRAEERLTFDLQTAIAPKMGYTDHAGTRDVERFMKHYFLVAKDVGDLTRIFCSALEAEHNRRSRFRLLPLARRRRIEGFTVEGDRLGVASQQVFEEAPVKLLKLFQVAQKHDLDIQPQTLRWVTRSLKRIDADLRADPEANRLFLEMLTSPKDPETTLRRMNEAGVFGRFVPDFGRVVAQMQYNMYHHYTVDEHTIFAIGILHAIEQGALKEEAPIASEVVHQVLSRRVLYMAVLLHDIAKGRGGDHSEIGAEIAHKLCPRVGLSEEETETVAWLVLHHLLMSDTAFRRDIDDPQTIQDFADSVQSIERLRLLLVLTVADIRAVGPGTWNAWKAALLRELYWRTEEVLDGGFAAEGRSERVAQKVQALREALTDWPAKEVEAHLKRGYPSYWLSCDLTTLERHAHLVRQAERERRALTIDTRIDRYREVTEVTVYTPDHPGLFSRIAGAVAVAGGNIDAARIFTLSNGMALDIFWIQSTRGTPFDRPNQIAKLAAAIERSLSGRLRPLQELTAMRSTIPSRLEVFKVPPRVLIDNKASARHTVIEVNGRDRPGLLYEVTQALTKLNLIIHSAKISTYGERVVDAFYVQDALGDKVENPARLRRIRQRLLQALEDQKCRPAPAALAGEVRATRVQAGRLRAATKPQGKTRKRADAGD